MDQKHYVKRLSLVVGMTGILATSACVNGDFALLKSGLSSGPAKVLTSVGWVADNLENADVRILEIGKERKGYDAGHIPGAVYVDWLAITDKCEPVLFSNPKKCQMAALLAELGIGPKTTVILYDDMNSRLATRMFWSLNYYGHTAAKVLNGGKAAWSGAKKALSSEVPKVAPTSYAIEAVDPNSKASFDFVKAAVDQPGFLIIDGRPTKHYTGEAHGAAFHTGQKHKRLGHIKGAINIPWTGNFNEDGTFKSTAKLKAMYLAKGVTKDKIVITYCNEGLHAAPPWFVLSKLLGYPDVRLYDNSMAEWANRDDTPMETGN